MFIILCIGFWWSFRVVWFLFWYDFVDVVYCWNNWIFVWSCLLVDWGLVVFDVCCEFWSVVLFGYCMNGWFRVVVVGCGWSWSVCCWFLVVCCLVSSSFWWSWFCWFCMIGLGWFVSCLFCWIGRFSFRRFLGVCSLLISCDGWRCLVFVGCGCWGCCVCCCDSVCWLFFVCRFSCLLWLVYIGILVGSLVFFCWSRCWCGCYCWVLLVGVFFGELYGFLGVVGCVFGVVCRCCCLGFGKIGFWILVVVWSVVLVCVCWKVGRGRWSWC